MKLPKIALVVILLPFIIIVWNQLSAPDKWEHFFYPLEYKETIIDASQKYSLDPFMVTAIIYEESKFNASSESNVGAVGLMQVMPETGTWIAKKQGRRFQIDDLYKPEINIDMGSWYFNYLLAKYKDERLALAAYNSGDKNVDRWLQRNTSNSIDEVIDTIPFKETRVFVQRVLKTKKMYEKLYPGEFRELKKENADS